MQDRLFSNCAVPLVRSGFDDHLTFPGCQGDQSFQLKSVKYTVALAVPVTIFTDRVSLGSRDWQLAGSLSGSNDYPKGRVYMTSGSTKQFSTCRGRWFYVSKELSNSSVYRHELVCIGLQSDGAYDFFTIVVQLTILSVRNTNGAFTDHAISVFTHGELVQT